MDNFCIKFKLNRDKYFHLGVTLLPSLTAYVDVLHYWLQQTSINTHNKSI